MTKANDIRKNITLVPDTTGLYVWWFLGKDARRLFCCLKSNICHNKIDTKVYNGKTYWALYVGKAQRETIRKRINWHINQKHTNSAIKSGYLSTLRHTLSSLLGLDESVSESAVNKIMDRALIDFYPLSPQEIDKAEKQMINNGYYLLNIRDNKSVDKSVVREIKHLRKIHKK